MPSADIIHTQRFSDAKSFLHALHPSSDLWSPQPRSWIFRGHADAEWALIPSAFRDAAYAAFDPHARGLERLPENARSATEMLVLRQFCEGLDRAGLPMPGMTRTQLSHLTPETQGSPQWPRNFVEVAALAQHHGIPTRLLDFTASGFVAAYFAAGPTPAARGADLAVWAIHTDAIRMGTRCNGIWFDLLRAGRSGNPNLHAQSGIFVAWTGSEQFRCLAQIIAALARGEIQLCSGTLELPCPSMRKLILPRDQASELLGMLVDERITGATMFPGVDGVVRSLKEQAFHRRFEPL
jgi:hypothetical protein